MYRKRILFLHLFSVWIAIGTTAQTQVRKAFQPYIVDARIKDTLAGELLLPGGQAYNAIDVKIISNDSLVKDYDTDGRRLELGITESRLHGDTLSLIGSAHIFDLFSFRIDLFKDTCRVSFFMKMDNKILRLHKEDPPTDSISVPCSSYRLILAQKPAFKSNQVIEGLLDLTSDNFYERIDDNRNATLRFGLRTYFRSRPQRHKK